MNAAPLRSPPEETEDLIRTLSLQAGQPQQGRGLAGALTFRHALAVCVFLSMLAALAVVLVFVGPRPGLSDLFFGWMVQFKLIAMGVLAVGAVALVRRAATAGARMAPLPALLPAILLLAAGLAFDRTDFPLTGVHGLSVVLCMGMIVLAAVPALGLILAVMRTGTPTRPGLAGALAGLLAGSLAGLAYSIACINDGTAFVALWYTLAIAIVVGMGAALGSRFLAW